MVSVVNKLLSLTWVGDVAEMINGNKTVLGLVSLAVWVLNIIPSVFPELGLPFELAANIERALLWIGVTLTPIGAAHKVVKAVDEKKKN